MHSIRGGRPRDLCNRKRIVYLSLAASQQPALIEPHLAIWLASGWCGWVCRQSRAAPPLWRVRLKQLAKQLISARAFSRAANNEHESSVVLVSIHASALALWTCDTLFDFNITAYTCAHEIIFLYNCINTVYCSYTIVLPI